MTKLFKQQYSNATSVAYSLVNSLGVKVNVSTIDLTLQEHPDFPDITAISDSLNNWHLANETYQINPEKYNVNELLFPFIAHLNENGGCYMLVHQIANGFVDYSDDKKSNGRMPEPEFLERWSYIALHATASENSAEVNYKSNKLKENYNKIKIPLLIAVVISMILFNLNYQSINTPYLIFLLLKTAGVFVSILLLIHSIDANNPLIQNICSLGKKNNCNAILKSDAANVTSWLTWSEVGFFYFTGSLISLILAPSSLGLLAWLNLFALPYTIYSIQYQYKNQNWCVMCCAVQALLLFEAITTLTFRSSFGLFSLNFELGSTVYLLLIFLLPILTWTFLKTLLLNAQQIAPLKNQLKTFKYNSELFVQSLKSQPKYSIKKELLPIVFGNPDASIELTIVSNLFCQPCAEAHELINDWLSQRDDIKVNIILTTFYPEGDIRTTIAQHLFALNALTDKTIAQKALNQWFTLKDKNYKNLSEQFPVEITSNLSAITTIQKEWCNLTEIDSTPTILINGYKLQEPYQLQDLKYLLN